MWRLMGWLASARQRPRAWRRQVLGLALAMVALAGVVADAGALALVAQAEPWRSSPAAVAIDEGEESFTLTLTSDSAENRVPTGTGFALIVRAMGGTPPYRFQIDRFLPAGPVPGPAYTFIVPGTDSDGDALFCPGELTFRARAVDDRGATGESPPLTLSIVSRIDFAIELSDWVPDLDTPLLRLVRPNLFGARSPYTITWEFGDGSEPVSLPARHRRDNGVFHTFPAAGSYRVRASVTDSCSPPQSGVGSTLLHVGSFP